MARNGVVSRRRRSAARKHASQAHTCPLCQKVIKGNGGWSSHKRMHVRNWVKGGRRRLALTAANVAALEYWEKKYELHA